MPASRVYIVDSDRLFLEGMRQLFVGDPFAVCGEAMSLAEARDLDPANAPDLMLLDYAAGDVSRLEEIRALRRSFPGMRIVVLSDAFSSAALVQCFDAGAHGFLLKSISSATLKQWLQLVMIGETAFPTGLAALLAEAKPLPRPIPGSGGTAGLSPREVQILQCLLNGAPNKVIAHQLGITESTIKVHLKGILRKIRATNRTEAAIWALHQGLEPSQPAPGATRTEAA